MKPLKFFITISVLGLISCGTPKSYFTAELRNKIEKNSISVDKLQYYVDRDVELKRELRSGEAKVSSGKVKLENGKYIHIIKLKKFTKGVCTKINSDNTIEISFEAGDGKSLVFGVVKGAKPYEAYRLYPTRWIRQNSISYSQIGEITYDGKTYYIQPGGSAAKLMIKKIETDKFETKQRVMKGRKIQ